MNVQAAVSARQLRFVHVLALAPIMLALMIRLAQPYEFGDDQAEQALYVLDVQQNGNWILPASHGTDPTARPPLYVWLAALIAAFAGDVSRRVCQIPSIACSLLLIWSVFSMGRERWNEETGLAAAWMLTASHTMIDLAVQVQPDMLLTSLVALGIFAVHRLEVSRMRGAPALFWSAFALSALAMGILGPMLLSGTLALLYFSPQHRSAARTLLHSRWTWMLSIPVLWAALAYIVGGSSYVTETFLQETVSRALGIRGDGDALFHPGRLLVHFVSRSFPWSVIALSVLPLALAPAPNLSTHRLFLPGAALTSALVLLSLARAEGPDYILPLLPFTALLAAVALLQGATWIQRTWQMLIWIVSAGVSTIAAIAWAPSGEAAQVQTLAPFATLGAVWASILIVVGVGLGWLAWRAHDPNRARLPQLLGVITSLMTLHALYSAELASTVRHGNLHEFAAQVRTLRSSEDHIRVLEGVSPSLFFLLGQNDPPLTLEEIEAFAAWSPLKARSLVVSTRETQQLLDARWPNRFRSLLQPLGPAAADLALLEVAPRSGGGS